MSVIDVLQTAQYVLDKHGEKTAILLDLSTWHTLQRLLEELAEDERLDALMTAVQENEKLEGEAAREAYKGYLLEKKTKHGLAACEECAPQCALLPSPH